MEGTHQDGQNAQFVVLTVPKETSKAGPRGFNEQNDGSMRPEDVWQGLRKSQKKGETNGLQVGVVIRTSPLRNEIG